MSEHSGVAVIPHPTKRFGPQVLFRTRGEVVAKTTTELRKHKLPQQERERLLKIAREHEATAFVHDRGTWMEVRNN